MQTGTVENRITAATLQEARILPVVAEQVYVDDMRLRAWLSTTDGPDYAAPDTTYAIVSDPDFGDAIQKGSDLWDLGYQDLGVNTPVTLPDDTSLAAAISSVALDATTDIVCFYANQFRGSFQTGIWVMLVKDDGAGHLYWSDPKCLYPSLAVDPLNGSTKQYLAFPRITTVGDEFWITALECSRYAGHERYHLQVLQSRDGIHWSDRLIVLAGASLDSDQTLGIYKYDTATPFTREDLLGAYLAVEDMFVYLLSPNSNKWVTDATLRVGVENPLKRLDLTAPRKSDGLSLSAAPSAGSGGLSVKNPSTAPLSVNGDDDILRRGAMLTRKGGYRTTEGDELVTMALEYIDESPDAITVDDDVITIQTRDGIKKLQAPDYIADAYFEYPSPQQVLLEEFCDFSAFMPDGNGSFRINNGARLIAGSNDEDSPSPDNLILFNFDRASDGVIEAWIKHGVTWDDHHAGLMFNGTDEKNYWAVLFNVNNSGKFELRKAIPHPKKRSHRKLKYMAPVTPGTTVDVPLGHFWGLRVQFAHGHVQASYTRDGVDWDTVVDYDSTTADPADMVVSNLAYFGLIGTSTLELSDPIGNRTAKKGPFVLCNASGRHDLALRVQTGDGKSYLRQIGAVLSQANLPPNVTLGLLYDPDNTGAAPPDATNPENVVYAQRMEAAKFDSADSSLIQWAGINVPGNIRLHGNTYYWIWIHFNKTPTGDKVWNYYSEDPAANTYGVDLTQISDDDGETWGSLDDTSKNLAAAMIVDYDRGTTRFRSANVASGRMPHTLEDIVKDLAAKAGVLECRVDDCPDTALLGDCAVFATGVNLTGVWGVNLRGANGYRVEFDPATAMLTFYAAGSNIGAVPSLQYFEAGTPFDLALFHHKGAFYVYINRCLATIYFNDSIVDVGFPTNTGDGTVDSFRVPDLTRVQEYFVLEADQDVASALQKLTEKSQIKYFMDFAGRLRIGTFRERAVVATFEETVQVETTGSNDDLWGSQRAQQGERYATYFDAVLLDTDGRRVLHADDTSAFLDEDAYVDGELAQVAMRELLEVGTLEVHGAVPTLEREDRIQDGSGRDWIVNDIEFRRPDPAHFTMRLGVRKYVPFVPVEIIPTNILTDDANQTLTDDLPAVLEED